MINLNSIILTDSLVAELYSSGLIDTSQEERTGSTKKAIAGSGPLSEAGTIVQKPVFNYLGSNRKNILILAEDKEAVYFRDQSLDFLTGILTACKLSLEDVAVINHVAYPRLTYKELVARLQPKVMLLFDTTPSALDLPLDFPHFQIQPFSGVSYLSSPGLAELENDKLLKSKLWISLKRLFNI